MRTPYRRTKLSQRMVVSSLGTLSGWPFHCFSRLPFRPRRASRARQVTEKEGWTVAIRPTPKNRPAWHGPKSKMPRYQSHMNTPTRGHTSRARSQSNPQSSYITYLLAHISQPLHSSHTSNKQSALSSPHLISTTLTLAASIPSVYIISPHLIFPQLPHISSPCTL